MIAQYLFHDIFARMNDLKHENKRLRKRIKRSRRHRDRDGLDTERQHRLNRELGFSVSKAVHDVGRTYQKMDDLRRQTKHTNLQIVVETGRQMINKVIGHYS
jgi:hypothetical protein